MAHSHHFMVRRRRCGDDFLHHDPVGVEHRAVVVAVDAIGRVRFCELELHLEHFGQHLDGLVLVVPEDPHG